MHQQTSKPDARRAAPKPGLVIAAIGFQLLLCSLATAAGACSDTIDRSARRFPGHVAQVFKEIADRHGAAPRDQAGGQPGYRLNDCPRAAHPSAPREARVAAEQPLGAGLLNLAPPAMG